MTLPAYMGAKWDAYWQMSREDRDALKNNSLTVYADECEPGVVPYLEIENGVPENTLTIDEKRKLVAKFIELHRVVGTPASIMEMLRFLSFDTEEYPARIIEYRNVRDEVYVEIHDGVSMHDGASQHNGGSPIWKFHLRWYQIKIILSAPVSASRVALAYDLIRRFIPVRCELVEIVRNLGNYHDGASLHNGTTIHG